MQRSSPSIAALATALAKAQIELTNPEKSLIGTIEPQRGQGGARQFRYAPLSSGLEIVRKTLGQYEIATVQTTAIDQAVPYRGAPMRPAWIAGSSGNIGKFPVVAGVERLVILIDHDANGAAQKSARICAERWKAAGRAVLLLTPRRVGADFNDLI
jgi:hypothetical protein